MFKVVDRPTEPPCGCKVGKEMGVNTWAAFGGSDDAAVVDGDFAMLENELQPVLKALRKDGINIVAIHQHMDARAAPRTSSCTTGARAKPSTWPSLSGGFSTRRRRSSHKPRVRPIRRRTMKRRIAVMTGVLLGANVAGAQPVDFNADSVGASPEGWTITMTGKGAPKWTVERDDTAPSKGQVLKQSGKATYPLALKDGTSIRDGFVEVKLKTIAGTEDRAGGIVWRAKDADNYYVVRANALEDNVVLYKTVDGKRSALDIVGRKGGYGVKVPVPANQWHTLRVDFAGTRFKVLFNAKPLFEVEDATFREAGMVGLWTKADSVTAFDGFGFGEGR